METGSELDYIENGGSDNSESWNRQRSSDYLRKFVMERFNALDNSADDDLDFGEDVEQIAA